MRTQNLMTYNPMAQHMGSWLLGYNWNIYGTGTYANPVSVSYAEILMKRFMERLDRKLGAPVSYFAALERRTSGCGLSPIAAHWHFLAACPRSEGMARIAEELWEEKFGNAKIVPYDKVGNAAFYVCKLANHPNGLIQFNKLEQLAYDGPSDLLAAAAANPYVSEHLKGKVFGEYLVAREAEAAS
jgi:hypothetical protein